MEEKKGIRTIMKRKLVIDGNAVYEIDEECMLKKRLDQEEKGRPDKKEESKNQNKSNPKIR